MRFAEATIGATRPRLYHPLVPVACHDACKFGCVRVGCVPVRDSHDRWPTPDVRSSCGVKLAAGTDVIGRCSDPQTVEAVEGADAVGCAIRPIPRGIGESAYVTAPNTMIESTLMTQSRIVIAVASASGTP